VGSVHCAVRTESLNIIEGNVGVLISWKAQRLSLFCSGEYFFLMIVIKCHVAVGWAASHPVLACQLTPPSCLELLQTLKICLHGEAYGGSEESS
jgi:hypothetical protein